jgi:hypothetical protein
MAITTIEIEIIKSSRGIDAAATLWRHSTADLWFIHDQVGAAVGKKHPRKEELINAILGATHPQQRPAIVAVRAEQAKLF